ncbi:MAG: hypothetical protein V7754_11140 [Halioglobus sp.]
MQEKTKRPGRKRQQTKDRVLQARIPEQLDEELRDRAEHLGLSVSTIVRNVLLHTFDLVEGVVIDSSQIARALTGREATTADPDIETTVIGWQEVVLNKNGVCEECNAILPVGQRAAIGVPTGPRPTLLCMECLAALPSSTDNATAPTIQKSARKRPSKRTPPASKKTVE